MTGSDIEDLIARADDFKFDVRQPSAFDGIALMSDLVKALSSLRAENEELAKALELFVAHYEPWMDKWPDDQECITYSRVTFGQLSTARSVLAARK